jgi:hypothetical protein
MILIVRTVVRFNKMPLRFINVDLDIESKQPLDHLCLELSTWDIHHLYCGPSERGFLARLECANGGETCEPDSIINKFCDAIERIDERALGEWQAANFRCFDLGYETTGADQRWNSAIRHSTLSRVVSIGASLAFTAYPRNPSEQDGASKGG